MAAPGARALYIPYLTYLPTVVFRTPLGDSPAGILGTLGPSIIGDSLVYLQGHVAL